MSTPQRLPIVNSDDGTWGDIIRQYLKKEHYDDGTDNAVNGGHQNITVRAGTATAGTAPLKFTSGTLLTAAEAGAVEFNSDSLYFTITTGTTRKKVAIYNDASGATGDMYYRDSGGNFVRVGIGSTGQALTVSGGLPVWGPVGSSTFVTASKTTNYTITTTDTVIFADATSGNVTITLPTASGVSGYRFYIKRIDNTTTNSVVIDPSGTDTIDGFNGINVLSQFDTYEIVSNGSVWYVLSSNLRAGEVVTSTINFRSVSTAVQASSAAVTVTKPTGVALGDVLIAYFTVYPSATVVTLPAPTGWTAIGSLASYTVTHQIYSQAFYKVASSSEPSSYTFTSAVAKPCDVAVMAYTGVDTNNPIDVSSAASGSGTSRSGTAVTTTSANDMLLYLSSGFSGSITSGPANMTQRAVYDGTDNYLYDMTEVATGSTGTITGTGSASDSWTVNLVALKPAGSNSATIDFSEDFENGTSGNTLTTGTTGFNSVVTGGTITFDTAHTVNGALAMKVVSSGAGGNFAYAQRTLSSGSLVYSRFSVYINALPGANLMLCAVTTAGNTDAADIRITTTGTMQVRNNGTAVATSSTTVSAGTWFMLEYGVDATNSIQTLRIYSGLTTDTIQEVVTATYTGGAMVAMRYGIIATASCTLWIDALATSTNNWIGNSITTTIFSGPVIFNNTAEFNGFTNLSGTTDVYGYLNVLGTSADFNTGVTFHNGLTVSSGGATITGNTSVTGTTTSSSTLTVSSGGANITGTLAVTGSETISSNLTVTGAEASGNDFWDNPSITPVANTPTSITESYPTLKGAGSVMCEVTANTTAIGSAVQGVAYSSAGTTSTLIWIYRTNTTSTGVTVHVHREIT